MILTVTHYPGMLRYVVVVVVLLLCRPHLSNANLYGIIGVNVGCFIFTIILLRVIWAPPSQEEIKQQKELERKINELQQSYMSLEDRREAPIDVYEGESAG